MSIQYKDLTELEKDELIASVDIKGANQIFAKRYNVADRTVQKWKCKLKIERDWVEPIRVADEKLNKSTADSIKQLKENAKQKIEEADANLDLRTSDQKKITKLENELKKYKKAINSAKTDLITADDVKELIAGCKNIGFKDDTPKWIDKTSKKLVPVICLSDIHIGEVVEEGDIGYGDSYDTDLAHSYADSVVNDFIGICKKNMNYKYDGCVMILGGDIIAGNNMHNMDETNDRTAIQQVVEGGNLIIRSINALLKEFGKVFVPAVTGNHDRLDGSKYTRTKNRTENSLGTMVYYFVQQHFKDNKNVSIITSKSDEVNFSVNGHRFNLQHGDTIKGGNGIGGVAVPILRARAKKLQAAVAVDKAFDTLIIGHFHQSITLRGLVVMNSLKIYDEYSKSLGFAYSRPGATTFFVNEYGELIYHTDIIIRKESKEKNKIQSIKLF